MAGRRLAVVGGRLAVAALAGWACVAVFVWTFDTRTASAAQVFSSPRPPARAPRVPPLSVDATSVSPAAEASDSTSQSGGDPLVENGLGSPMCRAGTGAELSQRSARNCRISGFEAAQAPTGDYAFDVHINTGVADWGNDLSASMQNAAQWGWMLLVAIVHGVIVMLEWCYAIDLLDSSAMGSITRGLRETQTLFTQPWLVLALAVASVLALYHGIVRRRVAQTLGEAALMAVMMLGGFWVIVDPMGTVGALDGWATEASLGTLAAVTAGTPEHPERALADGMGSIFDGAIDEPWCFMEFGNVRWCNDPGRLDPRLRAAALKIATRERAKIGAQSAELLRSAQTNGELFLALPANGPARNSINESGSLFNVLCGGSEEPCHGPTAKEAEFRTGSGTIWRVAGLWLFWLGVLGMLLLLGFIALRLLGAAIFSIFFLLLAPAAVIAPALGDGGRAAFRAWVTRLLGAVCAKLIYSFLLGVVLLMQRTLMSFSAFGWAAQWLLVSAMWWWLFVKRHQVNGFAHGEHWGEHQHRSLLRRAREQVERPPEVVRAAKWVKGKLRTPAPSVERRRRLAQASRARAKGLADGQVKRMLELEHAQARAFKQTGPETRARISAKQGQLQRVRQARATALEGGDRRKAAELAGRAQRIEREVEHEQETLDTAWRTADDGDRAKRKTGSVYSREQAQAQARLLDAQADLPSRGRAGPGGEKRDYARLAGLAGYGRREYEDLDRRRRSEARVQIDRELALRKELSHTSGRVLASGEEQLNGRERSKANREYDRSVERRMREEGHRLPASFGSRSGRLDFEANPQKRRATGSSEEIGTERTWAGGSSVMRDAREVAARRKRQLGREDRR